MSYKKQIGRLGENLAAKYFENHGHTILARNFSAKCGEIDLIVEKDNQIFIVEVKTRRTQTFGWAEETISRKKLQNIISTYEIFRRQRKMAEFSELLICVIEINRHRAGLKIIKV